MQLATVATCNLDQWALDFEGNLARIRASIEEARERGARFRLGPELEVPGYGCEDAFLEHDTERHSWEVLAELLKGDLTDGILCDIGMPALHKNVRYNVRVFVLDRQILLIRPKLALADEGNYRESRWFAAWRSSRAVEPFSLPLEVREVTGQETVPIGDAALATRDTVIASESCEELFTPDPPHIYLGLDGVEIIANGSGSHHQLGKLQRRLQHIRGATVAAGGVYLYANQQGCDGGRLYFDGGAMIVINGDVVAQGSQFSPRDVEVITARVDLEQVRSYRASVPSRMRQAAAAPTVPRVEARFGITDERLGPVPSRARPLRIHTQEEEIALGPACWLWDYLRRSRAGGFFLALSGGSDSAAVAVLVASMCRLVEREVNGGNPTVLRDLRVVLGLPDDEEPPLDPRALAGRLLTTAHLASEVSSSAGRERARALAEEIGADHHELRIDGAVEGMVGGYADWSGRRPRFEAHGGEAAEDAALQNVQARSRMVMSYLLAQLGPAHRGRHGPLLVLGTSNVDETLRGYVTKYDTSSADLNPIGGMSKADLRRFLEWARQHMRLESLDPILEAPPSAELTPEDVEGPQQDERDMGMTYAELSRFGVLRKVHRCGPLEMFERLVAEWDALPPADVAAKVRHFFRTYAANRHKTTVLTPSYFAEAYAPDDHRFDHRPFLYDTNWPWQFRAIERRLDELSASGTRGREEA